MKACRTASVRDLPKPADCCTVNDQCDAARSLQSPLQPWDRSSSPDLETQARWKWPSPMKSDYRRSLQSAKTPDTTTIWHPRLESKGIHSAIWHFSATCRYHKSHKGQENHKAWTESVPEIQRYQETTPVKERHSPTE